MNQTGKEDVHIAIVRIVQKALPLERLRLLKVRLCDVSTQRVSGTQRTHRLRSASHHVHRDQLGKILIHSQQTRV